MTKKFIYILLFILAFIVILSIQNKVEAVLFTDVNDNTYNIDTNDDFFEDYYIVYQYYGSTDFVAVFTSTSEFYLRKESGETYFFIKSSSDFKARYYYADGTKGDVKDMGSAYSCPIYKDYQIIYNNHDLKHTSGNIIFPASVKDLNTYLNFESGGLIYSIYGLGLTIRDYIAVFKSDGVAVIFMSDDHPTYRYENNTYYLHTTSSTSIDIFDFKTNKLVYGDYSKYSTGGLDMAFKKEQLIFCNFVLYDEDGYVVFNPMGTRLSDNKKGSDATGNFVEGGSVNGNSYLDDYITGSDSDYNGSGKHGSDTISGGFNRVYNNFGFTEDVKKNVNGMVDVITNTKEVPKFQINVNSKYYKGTLTIVDLSWYAPYKDMGDNVICIFAYLTFLWRIFIKLPDIIRGAGASSYASNMLGDIEAFRKTGFGRSSSPRDKTF